MLDFVKSDKRKQIRNYGLCSAKQYRRDMQTEDASKFLKAIRDQQRAERSILKEDVIAWLKAMPLEEQKKINGEFRELRLSSGVDIDYYDWLIKRRSQSTRA